MKNSRFKAMGLSVFFLLFFSVIFTPAGMAQGVTKVKATLSATESGTECRVEYTFKNGSAPLKELTASTILFQDTKVSNMKASDKAGDLEATGSSTGGKYSTKIALREPIPPEGVYSFTLAYDVGDSMKSAGGKTVLTAPLLSLPWKSTLSKEPACSIEAMLPSGMNLIRTSPKIDSTTLRDSRVVAHASSAILTSFFRAEFTKEKVGFFTPENIVNVCFFGAIAFLIALWLYYNFIYLKRKSA
jgi:hypothetical protein